MGGRSWIDDRKLRYPFDPSKHGATEQNRAGRKAFRFCYEVLSGFHYDLEEDSGGWFHIEINGKESLNNNMDNESDLAILAGRDCVVPVGMHFVPAQP